jgi:hypothetical protein
LKYRKKPIVIDAFKLGEQPYPAWFKQACDLGVVEWRKNALATKLAIQTLEGEVYASEGEHYILKGIKGEIYPCLVEIFEQIYEAVE